MSKDTKTVFGILGVVIIVLGIYFFKIFLPHNNNMLVATAVEIPVPTGLSANQPDVSESEFIESKVVSPPADSTDQKTLVIFFACCDLLTQQVFPVERLVVEKEPLVGEAIKVLLLGPLEEEKTFTSEGKKTSGYWTAIPEGTQLIDFQINGKEVSLTFNEKLEKGITGSAQYCALIRDQIECTVKQLGFTKVTIKIPGKEPYEVLQP